jgi:hypothetical protein
MASSITECIARIYAAATYSASPSSEPGLPNRNRTTHPEEGCLCKDTGSFARLSIGAGEGDGCF